MPPYANVGSKYGKLLKTGTHTIFIRYLCCRFSRPSWDRKSKKKCGDAGRESVQRREMVHKMKACVTAHPKKVIEVVNQYGRLKILDERELVVEAEEAGDLQKLQKALQETFEGEVNVEVLSKK